MRIVQKTYLHVKTADHHHYIHHFIRTTLTVPQFYLEQSKEKMRSRFIKREYPKKPIDSEIRKTKFNTRETNRKNKSKNGVPVVSLPFVSLPFSLQYHQEKYLSSSYRSKGQRGARALLFSKNQVLKSQYRYIYTYKIDYLHLSLTGFSK